jgi:hypothetical protein
MLPLEQKLFNQLKKLKEEFGLLGVKAEFETEGSSFRDLVRLRRLTAKLDIDLFLKIGGVEAVRDLKDALELGVDGVIAPMVESKFGLKKFLAACQAVYRDAPIHKSINIETAGAACEIDDILALAPGNIHGITFGRTDLCDSYFDKNITPDGDFILGLILDMAQKTRQAGLAVTLGGSISSGTASALKQNGDRWRSLVDRIETRKAVFSTATILEKQDVVQEALKFEEFYILAKKEITDRFMEPDMERLNRLRTRL